MITCMAKQLPYVTCNAIALELSNILSTKFRRRGTKIRSEMHTYEERHNDEVDTQYFPYFSSACDDIFFQ